MKFIYILFTILFSLLTQEVMAQDNYSKAVTEFNRGNFEMVDSLLEDRVGGFSRQNQVQAYRMLAISALKQDRNQDAWLFASRLLEVDPYYSEYNADPRFEELLDRARKKMKKAKITTASWVEESIEEAPVPMTLITERMLRASGARTLSDVLLLYVPGLTKMGGIEDNVAMRGVSGLTQETVLVLENGNRMNSYSTNAQPMDYRINLDKVKQIEVLRGPASSLYGSVALTAVVNVITKTEADLNGGEISAHTGTFNSYGGSFIYGKGNLESDIFGWFSMYNAKGQKVDDGGIPHYVEGYNSMPTFDIGINGHWGDVKFMVTGNHGKPVPYNNLIGFENATADKYMKLQGEKPGMSRTNLRFDLAYSHKWDDFGVSGSAFASYERMQLYNVVSDKASPVMSWLLAATLNPNAVSGDTLGLFQSMNWADYCVGGTLCGTYNYKLPRVGMKGSVLAGVQYECFMPVNGDFYMGCDFDSIKSTSQTMLYEGSEHTISGIMQLKHYFTDKLILNGGLRYDHRIQYNKSNIRKFSPRVSLIWLANKTMTLKGSYSHSFVDAPYLYRASTINLFAGQNLKPESMNSFQLTGNFNWQPLHLSYECNLFFNMVSDLVFYDVTGAGGNTSSSTFTNAGKINMGGIEHSLQYTSPRFLASLNLTYQYPFKIEQFYSYSAHELANVPKFIGNIVTSWNFISSRRAGDFHVRANLHAQSAFHNTIIKLEEAFDPYVQLFKIGEMYKAGLITDEQALEQMKNVTAYEMPFERQPFQAILNAGLEWNSPWRFNLAVDAYNICNTKNNIGSLSRSAIPQQGFSVVGTVKFRF